MKEKVKNFFNKSEVVNNYRNNYKKGNINLKILKSLKNNSKVLSLGCGGGREVRELLKKECKVTALDICENMVNQSNEIEQNANYFCIDAVDFSKENKNKLKFDYILGLFSFLSYIEKEDRKELINNLYIMLNKDGKMYFEVRKVNDRWKDILKVFYFWVFGKPKEFGDIFQECYSHHYTTKQLKLLFKPYKHLIKNNLIILKK